MDDRAAARLQHARELREDGVRTAQVLHDDVARDEAHAGGVEGQLLEVGDGEHVKCAVLAVPRLRGQDSSHRAAQVQVARPERSAA